MGIGVKIAKVIILGKRLPDKHRLFMIALEDIKAKKTS